MINDGVLFLASESEENGNRQKNPPESNFYDSSFSIKFNTEMLFAFGTTQPELNISHDLVLLHGRRTSCEENHHMVGLRPNDRM